MLMAHGGDPDSWYILDGVVNGFKLVDPDAEVPFYCADNYASATVNAFDQVNEIVLRELEQGKLSVVDCQPHCVHAMGAVAKKGGTKIRNITDASRPKGRSINCFMKETFSSFSYKTMDDVCKLMSPNCFCGVTDISAAYRSVPIRPADRTIQGLSWEIHGKQRFLVDNFLSFGTRVAPYIFSRLTDAIARYMIKCGFKVVNYLDDFINVGASLEECKSGQLALHTLLIRLGFSIAYNKVVTPNQCVVYLGVEINSVTWQLRLPQEKLSKLKSELVFFSGRSHASKKQLQRLCGILGHCSTLVRGGRTFSHRVISLLKLFRDGKRRVRLSKGFQMDLRWWNSFASWFNGEARIIHDVMPGFTLTTDSSMEGFGAVSGVDWLAGSWDYDLSSRCDMHDHLQPAPSTALPRNINVLELYPVLLSLIRWGHLWRDRKVLCLSDNTQVVRAISTGRSANDSSMQMLRNIFWLCVKYNCHLVSEYVPGVDNVVPDYLSRMLSKHASSLPFYMCCYRGVQEVCRTGLQRDGDQKPGSGADIMGNPTLSMAELLGVLRINQRRSSPSGCSAHM